MTHATLTPLDAALLSAELLEHFDALSRLDLHPVTSAVEIEAHRTAAQLISEQLGAYLLCSPNFAPVIEQDDAVQEWQL